MQCYLCVLKTRACDILFEGKASNALGVVFLKRPYDKHIAAAY